MSAITGGAFPSPVTPRLAYLADVADVIEGRTDLAEASIDVRIGLTWDQQAQASAAAAEARSAAAWRAAFCERAGIPADDDAAYRDAVLTLAEAAARAEADAIYDAAVVWEDVDLYDGWRAVWEDTGPPAGTSLDTGQQSRIGKTEGPPRDPLGQALDRLHRNDRAKVGLSSAIRAAAVDVYDGDPAGAVILDSLARKVDGCRFVRAYRDVCGAWLARPESCHVRTCPDCERSRSARLVRRLDGIAQAMRRPKLVTLTVPNVPPGGLGAGIDVLIEAFEALRRRKVVAGGTGCRAPHRHPDDSVEPCRHPPHGRAATSAECRCAACIVVDVRGDALADGSTRRRVRGCRVCRHEPVAGGVYAIEVTYNPERGDWHPHVHALIDAPFVLWSELRDAWRAVTCDATRRAEIRGRESTRGTGRRRPDEARPRVRLARCPHRADEHGRPLDGCRGASQVWISGVGGPGQARTDAIRETVKYVTKGVLTADGSIDPRIGPSALAELLLSLRGRRLVAGWGALRGVTDDDPDADIEPTLAGPDVAPELRGLPVTCPVCRMPADWSMPVTVPRNACRPLPGGRLAWHPPPIGGPPS